MDCLCGMLLHNVCAKIEFLVASTGGLCSPLCGPYARLMHRSDRETARRQIDRERETEKEREKERDRRTGHRQRTNTGTERQAQRDRVKQSGPPSLMQTAYAHKPKSEFILLPMRSLVFALRCSVLAYAGLCASYVVRGIAYAMLMRPFFLIAFFFSTV